MLDNYLDIMIDSLEKKIKILTDIEDKSREQSEMIKSEEMLYADLDKNMDEKAEMIAQLDKLDEGFEALYSNIKDSLNERKEQHADKIRNIQSLIETVMAKSASIQVMEARNKADIEQRLSAEKKNLRERRTVSKAAYNYYLSTNKIDVVTPQFMDKKK